MTTHDTQTVYDETAAFYGGAYRFRNWIVVDPDLEPAEQRERIEVLR